MAQIPPRPVEIRPGRTEVANGHSFTSETRRYDVRRERTFYRIDGKLMSFADWSLRRRSCRRADEKAQKAATLTALGALDTTGKEPVA
jgi:hypothetical protein